MDPNNPTEKDHNARQDEAWPRKLWGALPWLFLLGLLIMIIILAFHIISEVNAEKERKKAALKEEVSVINVVTLEVTPAPIRDHIRLPGEVKPWVRLNILAEVRGRIVEKKVEEGSAVKKGQLLAVIDSRDYDNALAQTQAEYEVARKSLQRLDELFKEQLATQAQIDDVKARVEGLKAALDSAKLNVQRCQLKAAADGIVNWLDAEPGRFMNVGDKVAEVLQLNPVKVKVGIPESEVVAVRHIDTFDVSVDALDNRVFKGTKYFLSRTADPMARLYDLYIQVDNPDGEILPDMFTRVDILKKEIPDALVIPMYASLSKSEKHVVYVVQEDRAIERPVTLGIQEGWLIQVAEGLAPGENVVVVGQRSLNNGDKVNIVQQAHHLGEIHP